MKKLFIIISLTLISVMSFAQKDTSALTAREVYTDIKTNVSKLVESLKGPSEHVYAIYVRQFYIGGISWIFCSVLFLSIGLIMFFICWKKADFDDGNVTSVFSIVAFICIGIGLLILICFFTSGGFTELMNPEYPAIQKIIENFKP